MQAPLIKNPITDERRQDLLCGALEGGSNYWYLIGEKACAVIDGIAPPHKDLCFVDRLWTALKAGAAITFHDVDDGKNLGKLTMEKIYKGEALMLEKSPRHFADIIGQNNDATTADVWLQYALLGEIVYG